MNIRNIVNFCGSLLILIVLGGEQSHAEQHFCGKTLHEALELMCENGFNSIPVKRSMDLNLGLGNNILADYANYNEIEDEQEEELPLPYANSAFLNKIHGGRSNLMAKTRRRRRGIYDECCRKPCKYTELYSYCRQ